MPKEPTNIAVVAKAFSVLEILARFPQALALADIAEESRLPKPTVYRLLQSLRNLGYVEQNEERGDYALGERLLSLRQYERDGAARRTAWPFMQALHRRCNETVNLALLEGVFVRYAHVIETTQALRWIVKPGARDVFQNTALGRAIAAGLPLAEQERLVSRARTPGGAPLRPAARKRLLAELTRTRQRGWALDEEESAAGVSCLAVSLAAVGLPLAAVSVSVPGPRFTAELRRELITLLTLGPAALSADEPPRAVHA